MNEKPNLFKYATSELSQDAFICWLLEWAKPENEQSKELHECAIVLIKTFFEKHKKKLHKIKSIKIKPQKEKMDVFCVINKKEYAIIIEDKTNTRDHSDQLEKYYEKVMKMGFKEENIIPIYFKTGYLFPDEKLSVEKAKYSIFDRDDFLLLLNRYKNIKNDIFNDYRLRLNEIIKFDQKEIDAVIEDNKPEFNSHPAQIEYLIKFYEKLNYSGYHYSINHIAHGTNRSGSPWSELNLVDKFLVEKNSINETIFLRIDNNRKNPETEKYDYYIGLRQYCNLTGSKDQIQKFKELKLENLKKLKEAFKELKNESDLNYGKIRNDRSGAKESEIDVLFFNDHNTPTSILDEFPKIVINFINEITKEPLSYKVI